jgi:hypothetical protein
MKWDKPRPVTPPTVWPDPNDQEDLVSGKEDAAFADFNLPLLEQEVVGQKVAERKRAPQQLRGWDNN